MSNKSEVSIVVLVPIETLLFRVDNILECGDNNATGFVVLLEMMEDSEENDSDEPKIDKQGKVKDDSEECHIYSWRQVWL